MSTHPVERMTAEEYLVFERSSQEKHEYYRGEVFAMVGATRAHNRITSIVAFVTELQFRDRTCEVFVADMRVKINSDGSYVYPDVVATCLPPEFEDDVLDTLTNPQLIIEVLSDSTESYDRGKKFERYRAIETMTNYILIAQDRVSVEHFVRNENQVWELRPCNLLSDTVDIELLDCRLSLADVYNKVTLDQSDDQ